MPQKVNPYAVHSGVVASTPGPPPKPRRRRFDFVLPAGWTASRDIECCWIHGAHSGKRCSKCEASAA